MALTDVFSYYSSLSTDHHQSRPWRLLSFLWATNGNVMLAITDDGREAIDTPAMYMKAQRYLEEAPEHPQLISVSRLRSFAGPVVPGNKTCDECDGSGREACGDLFTCEHCGCESRRVCDACGGDGLNGIVINYGRVADVPLNCTLLAFGLAQVPTDGDDAATMGSIATRGRGERALLVVGSGWRLALMGCVDVSPLVPVFSNEQNRNGYTRMGPARLPHV